jgi:hypothetical protein
MIKSQNLGLLGAFVSRRVIKTIEVKMIYMVGKHAEDEHR